MFTRQARTNLRSNVSCAFFYENLLPQLSNLKFPRGVFWTFLFLILSFAFNGFSYTTYQYSYVQGFEGSNPVSYWTSNGTYTVNQIGIATDKVHSGNYSYVIDITFGTATYVYYRISQPNIACENKLNFSGWINVEQLAGTPYAGLGANRNVPPTTYSGCGIFETFQSTNNKWVMTGADMVTSSTSTRNSMVKNYVWGATGNNVGIRMDLIGIFIFGKSGDHIRIHLDDIKVEGTIPTAASYNQDIQTRWSTYTSLFTQTMDSFEAKCAAADSGIANLPVDLSAFETALKTLAQSRMAEIASSYNFTTIRNRGWITPAEHDNIYFRFSQANGIVKNIYDAREGMIMRGKHLLYAVNPTMKSIQNILSNAAFITAEVKSAVSVTTTPGEYEPCSFVIQTFDDTLSNLNVTITPLTCGSKMLPSAAIDIRAVKCWYQNGISIVNHTYSGSNLTKTLVPELLLKNDNLVRVNESTVYSEQTNSLNQTGSTYVNISTPDNPQVNGEVHWLNADWPALQDSGSLLPIASMSANHYKQFWVNVNVPSDTPAGEYSGFLNIFADAAQIGKYKFTVNVLPFSLLTPSQLLNASLTAAQPLEYSIYYTGKLVSSSSPYYNGTIGSEYRSNIQYQKEMENMMAHGITNPALYQGYDVMGLVTAALSMRQSAGMTADTLYFLGLNAGNSTDPATLAILKAKVTNLGNTTSPYGIANNYIYGIDEARNDDLLMQREAWEATHEAGGKVFVAGRGGNLALEYPYGKCLNLHFDENADTVAADLSGYGNDGVLSSSGASWATGKLGDSSIQFGTTGYVDCCGLNDSVLSIDGSDGITIEAWLYPTSYPAATINPIKKADAPNSNYAMEFSSSPGCKIGFSANIGGTWTAVSPTSDSAIPLNQWSHIVWTYSSTGGGSLYVNGSSQGIPVAGQGVLATNTTALRIGEGFIGKIDEVRIFDRVLRNTEISREYNNGNGLIQTVGDLLDLEICSGPPSSAEAAIAHQVAGHKIFSYANPQVGVEDPEIYRRNYGLKLWKCNYDGAMDFAYQFQFCRIWNDFDHTTYKDSNFVYPTIDGVIDTIQWEGFREGIDDIRYLATLQDAIVKAPASQLKTDAGNYVSDLHDTEILDQVRDVNTFRNTLIEHTLKLKGICGIWHFNEGEACTAFDSSPYGCNAILVNMGSSPWCDGIADKALLFDGNTSHYVDCGNNTVLSIDGSSGITVETWIYPVSTPTTDAHPISKWTDSAQQDANYAMKFSSDGHINFAARIAGTWQAASPISVSAVPLRKWTHIVWTYSSSAGGKLYVNGVSQGNAVGSGSLYTDAGTHLTLGQGLTGRMDEVKIYSRILATNEINESFMTCNDRCRIWNCDQSSGITLTDSSPNSQSGILTGNATWVTPGKSGGHALSFNGGYVDCGNAPSLNSLNYTIMGWVKPSGFYVDAHIIERGRISTPSSGFLMQLWNNNRIYVYQSVDGDFYKVAFSHPFPDTNYHHVAMVFGYDGENSTLKFYFDGSLINSKSQPGKPDLPPDSAHLYLGHGGFSGELDGFKIYSRILSDVEIEDDYNGL